MIEQIFLSPQVKQGMIISNKVWGTDKLPREMPNELKLRIFGN